ncbi:hypothetical protein MNBD_ALPHA06-2276 [hydrothermal vent metagenome]|uniref:Cell division protein ZapA n=1 Tax=hydrothermal vent metagenome TaxID=652676 RepID=A0A3B0RR92_9ZZZZ
MSKVSIRVNDRAFSIGCEPGQEAHVQKLGKAFDQKVSELVEQVGQIGDLRLFLMAALVISDELASAQAEAGDKTAEDKMAKIHTDASNALDEAAKRIEQLATQLGEAK